MDLRMLIPIMGILLTMIPVAGITLALTLRFAVKPFVETLAAAIKDVGEAQRLSASGSADLQTELHELREQLRRIEEGASFDRTLLALGENPESSEG
jgi:hypothetical protein